MQGSAAENEGNTRGGGGHDSTERKEKRGRKRESKEDVQVMVESHSSIVHGFPSSQSRGSVLHCPSAASQKGREQMPSPPLQFLGLMEQAGNEGDGRRESSLGEKQGVECGT